jgi:hypothetical protein
MIETTSGIPEAADHEAAAERSLVDDVKQLVEDGATLVEAELAYQRSRAVLAGQAAKGIAGLYAFAAVLGLLALVALVVGSVIALSPLVGPWIATLLVAGILLLSAWLAASAAARQWNVTTSKLSGDDRA